MNNERDINEIARELAHNFSPEQLREKWEQREAGDKYPAGEIGEAERAYWHNVFREPQRNASALMVSKAAKQEMEYGEARKKVWNLMQLRAAHISDLENIEFEWEFDEEERARNANLVKYFINDASAVLPDGKPFPLSKGLFLFGAPGTGKTEIMRVFEKFCLDNDLSKQFRFTSMSEVYTKTRLSADYDPVKDNIQFDRAFDEFGRYVGSVMRFGEGIDVNESILEQRYERMKRYGQLTHLIANLTPNETESQFSPMIFDRVRSMCTGVYFKGKSKRK